MMFAEYCCDMPLNPFWSYCPQCGKATSTKWERDKAEADRAIELRKRRLEGGT